MKKTYKKPITEVLPMLFTDYQMNTGSVHLGGDGGTKVSGIGAATNNEDIVTDGDGIGWGNARETSLWDDEPVEYNKGLW